MNSLSRKAKVVVTSAALVVLASGVLAGCGGASKSNPAATSTTTMAATAKAGQAPSTSKNDATGASQFAQSYYQAWFTTGTENTYNELKEALSQATEGIDQSKVSQDDPTSVFNVMTEDQQRDIAEKTTKINPMSDYYDTTGMSNSEIAVLNVIATGFSSGYHTDQKVTVAVNKDKVTVDGSTGSVPYTALTVTVGDKSNTPTETDFTLPLVYRDGRWKVDGKKFSSMVISNYAASQAANTTATPK